MKTTCARAEASSPESNAPRFLQEYEESRGHLRDAFVKDGYCVAVFDWGAVALSSDLEQELRTLVGHKVGILRIDGYRVRCLDNRPAQATRACSV